MKLSTDDLIRELEATVTEAGQCLRYWRVFTDPKHATERARVMNGYRLFFRTARQAFFATAIVDLHKLYDTSRGTATIRTLRARVRDERTLKYSAAVATADDAIRKALPIWERVRVLRHNLFAHRADDGDSEHWFRKAELSPSALFTLHSLSKTAVKNLSHARDGSSYAFNLEGSGEFDELLRDLDRVCRERSR